MVNMLFTRVKLYFGTTTCTKFTILVVRFFNVSLMSHIWWTRPGPEENIFEFYYFRGETEKVWSNSMISNVSMTVEKWYESIVFFYSVLIVFVMPILSMVFGMPILSMILWNHICGLTQGFPRKAFDLQGIVIGDNKVLITCGRWYVQTVCKDELKYCRYF